MKQEISLQSVLVGRLRLLVAVTVMAVLVACNDQTTPLESDGPLFGHKDSHGGGGGPPGGGGSGGPQLEPAIIVTFTDAGNDIRSDGRVGGVYEHGKCGVHATFNLKDVRLVPANQVIKKRDEGVCGGREDRYIAVTLEGTTYQGIFMNIGEVETVTAIEGTPALRTLQIVGLDGLCSPPLQFDEVEVFLTVGSMDDSTWTVRNQPGGSTAVCVRQDGSGTTDHVLSFKLDVRLQP